MNACPTPDQLRLMLEEDLPDGSAAEVEAHVSSCPACQELLDRLTTPPLRVARAPVGDSTPSPEAARFVNGLIDAAAPYTATPEPQTAREGHYPPRLEGYEFLGELGRGGMGIVFKARHQPLGRVVALKMIRFAEHADPIELTRFLAEAQVVATLQHPHIVPVFEVGQHKGLPYFTLEYVAGGSLGKRLAGQPQPAADAARIVEQLARAMNYAHGKGIIHRDLKPANVLLVEDSTTPLSLCTARITDFGLAKRTGGDGLTQSGDLMGTPAYMTPEQVSGGGKGISAATDVYSLGAILYEMVTGRPPFMGATAGETLLQVLHQDPVPPRQLQPRLHRDIDTICLKCLEKDPSRRYPTATALADDLRRFLDGQPTRARPMGPVSRGWKWARRHPAVATLTAALLLVISGALVGLTVLYLRAEEQRRRAEENERRAVADEAELESRLRQVSDQRDEIAQEKKRGDGLLDSAHATIESFLKGIRHDPTLKRPEFRALRRELLSACAVWYLPVIEGNHAKNRDRDMAFAHASLAMINLEVGGWSKAEEFLRKTTQYAARLNADPIARKHILERLGEGWHQLGTQKLKDGHRAEAAAFFCEAVAAREQLAAVRDEPAVLRGLADSSTQLGLLMLNDRRPEVAESPLRLAREALARLVSKDASEDETIFLGGTNVNLGISLTEQGKSADAMTCYDRAVEILTPVVAKSNPKLAREFLVNAETGRGRTLIQLNRPQEAVKAFDHAVEIGDARSRDHLRAQRTFAFMMAKDYAHGLAEAEALASSRTLDGDNMFKVARLLAWGVENESDTVTAQRRVGKAVEALRRAIAAGYLKYPGAVEQLKRDPEFRVLQDKTVFQELLRELAGKVD
jgi:tetratricopeptide (TPR) repeat protein/tRNA A-37 threonylcarbamoyl transferase component Bud32